MPRNDLLIRCAWVCLLLAAVLAIFASSGFTVAEVDRSVSIPVTDEQSAPLGIEAKGDVESKSDTEETLLVIVNQFEESVSIEVDVTVDGDGLSVSEPSVTPEELVSEDKAEVGAKIECEDEVSGSLVVELTASGDDVRVVTETPVEVNCIP